MIDPNVTPVQIQIDDDRRLDWRLRLWIRGIDAADVEKLVRSSSGCKLKGPYRSFDPRYETFFFVHKPWGHKEYSVKDLAGEVFEASTDLSIPVRIITNQGIVLASNSAADSNDGSLSSADDNGVSLAETPSDIMEILAQASRNLEALRKKTDEVGYDENLEEQFSEMDEVLGAMKELSQSSDRDFEKSSWESGWDDDPDLSEDDRRYFHEQQLGRHIADRFAKIVAFFPPQGGLDLSLEELDIGERFVHEMLIDIRATKGRYLIEIDADQAYDLMRDAYFLHDDASFLLDDEATSDFMFSMALEKGDIQLAASVLRRSFAWLCRENITQILAKVMAVGDRKWALSILEKQDPRKLTIDNLYLMAEILQEEKRYTEAADTLRFIIERNDCGQRMMLDAGLYLYGLLDERLSASGEKKYQLLNLLLSKVDVADPEISSDVALLYEFRLQEAEKLGVAIQDPLRDLIEIAVLNEDIDDISRKLTKYIGSPVLPIPYQLDLIEMTQPLLKSDGSEVSNLYLGLDDQVSRNVFKDKDVDALVEYQERLYLADPVEYRRFSEYFGRQLAEFKRENMFKDNLIFEHEFSEPSLPEATIKGKKIAVVGGSKVLQDRLAKYLEDLGARVVSIMPSWERSMDQSGLNERIEGSSFVFVITSIISHSTYYLIRNYGERGRRDNLRHLNSRGYSGLIREIIDHLRADRQGPKLSEA